MEKALFEELIDAINEVINLKNLKNPPLDDEAESYVVKLVLKLLFEIGKNGIEFTEEERKVIGPLLKEIIPKIERCISYIGWLFDSDVGDDNLTVRSGVQFLLDNFKEYPVTAEEKLGESLKIIQDSEDLKTFDEALINWKADPVGGYEAVVHSEADLTRPEGVPETHNWWWWP